jgi:hypothetical protein
LKRRGPIDFRRWIVHTIAFDTRWGLLESKRNTSKWLASELGVTDDVLEDAAALVRFGYRSSPGNPSRAENGKLMMLHQRLPSRVNVLMQNLAELMGTTRGALLCNLVHAAMRTKREPTRRLTRGGKKLVFRSEVLPPTAADVYCRITRALHKALHLRAAAQGINAHRYVRNWVLDLVDGKLGDLDLEQVAEMGQMFDDPKSYVLPRLPKLPR